MMNLKLVETDRRNESVSVNAKIPRVITEAIAKLQVLTQLGGNWDSYGALAPTRDALLGAIQLAMDLFEERTPVPDVFPTPNGNIQFEWSHLGLDIEIEIESNRRCIACFENLETGENWEKIFTFDLTDLRQAIAELSARNQQQNIKRVVNA